jgi:ionotropic glutamate receptor NMDA 2B
MTRPLQCFREEFPNLSGLEDRRLSNPQSIKPPFKFGTIPNGATDDVMKNNFPEMHNYMRG